MAKYIMEEMPDLQNTGKRITYPKFARVDNASIKELAQRVGDVSGFSPGDIEGILLQTSISRIRSKIEADGGAPYIKTVYGMGYQWTGGETK